MSLKILTGDWIDEDKTVTFLVDWANNHQLLATTKKLLLFSKKVRRGITRITVGRSQTWYLEHIAQYRIHVQVWCIVGSVSKLTQSARLENMRKSKRIRVDLSAKSATGTSPCKKKNGGSTKTRHIQKIAAQHMKNRKDIWIIGRPWPPSLQNCLDYPYRIVARIDGFYAKVHNCRRPVRPNAESSIDSSQTGFRKNLM